MNKVWLYLNKGKTIYIHTHTLTKILKGLTDKTKNWPPKKILNDLFIVKFILIFAKILDCS